ncbi:MAG: hypothetical protein HC906_10230 [Bacteroidales bacterium]|nr:hypothetical protein [Bacteroidales bacterium]
MVQKSFSFGYHYENKHFISDYAFQSLAAAFPTKSGTIGAGFGFYGNANYNESKISLAFAKPFGDKLSAGIQFDYLAIGQMEEYGNAATLVVEGGVLYKPIESISFGFHIYNPTQSAFRPSINERTPLIFEAGAGFDIGNKLLIVTEVEKNMDYIFVYKTGAEYKLIESVHLRAAVSTFKYSTYSFGLGFSQKKIKADIAFSHQPHTRLYSLFLIQLHFRENRLTGHWNFLIFNNLNQFASINRCRKLRFNL